MCYGLDNANKALKKSRNPYELQAYYQPVVSIIKKKIIGYEGLIRGIDKSNNFIISPKEIFDMLHTIEETIQLDRDCRDICLNSFISEFSDNKEICLFINLDTSIIKYVGGSSYLFNQVIKYDIKPQNIVIEIKESELDDVDRLEMFIENYKGKGFLIALDDVGTGFSNLERITIVKPDILKIDRTLVKDIEKSYYKQETFQGLVRLANKIGALIIAEGVETFEEAIKCLEYGAHFLQGYYFHQPQKLDAKINADVSNKAKELYEAYKEYLKNKTEKEKSMKKHLENEMRKFTHLLESITEEKYSEAIHQFLEKLSVFNLECAFVLDEQGVQISDTFMFDNNAQDDRKKAIFLPAKRGSDSSLKNTTMN